MQTYFISGIGTGVGKTLVSAILTEALGAAYWKPIQAGWSEGTDSQWIQEKIRHPRACIFAESYLLDLPASPHLSARHQGVEISLDELCQTCRDICDFKLAPRWKSSPDATKPETLLIEGAGGLLVPLNSRETVLDLIAALKARVILVSRNYLGSINHSLLSAQACRHRGVEVAGWVFNDQFMNYEAEIAAWTGLPILASIPFEPHPGRAFVCAQANAIRSNLQGHLQPHQGSGAFGQGDVFTVPS